MGGMNNNDHHHSLAIKFVAKHCEDACAKRTFKKLQTRVKNLQAIRDATPDIGPCCHDIVEDPTKGRMGNYKIDALLGTGGFGQVFLAHNHKTPRLLQQQRPVAIKVLFPFEHLHWWKQINQEVAILRDHSHHPNINTLHEVIHANCNVYLVLDKADTDLYTLCAETNIATTQPDFCQQAMLGVLRALAHLHQHGIAHCDVHPGNILVRSKDPKTGKVFGRIDAAKVLLCDFGLAKKSEELDNDSSHHSNNTVDNKIIPATYFGSGIYKCPERFCWGTQDARLCDMWGVGSSLMAINYGYPPGWKEAQESHTRLTFHRHMKTGLRVLKGLGAFCKSDGDVLLHNFLCHRLLRLDPQQRATAQEALQDPWFQYQYPAEASNAVSQ